MEKHNDEEIINVGVRPKKKYRHFESADAKRKFFLVRPYSLWPVKKDEVSQIIETLKLRGYNVRKDTFGRPDQYAVYAWNQGEARLSRIAVLSDSTETEPPSGIPRLDDQLDHKVPRKVVVVDTRIIRDTKASRDLKFFYDYKCQICGIRLLHGIKDRPYCEVHHIKPLSNEPPIVDDWSNMICLCPNHHAEMDYKMLYIDPDSKKVIHSNTKNASHGKIVYIEDGHQIEPMYLEYQKKVLCKDWCN